MKYIQLEKLNLSRVICGTNAFVGITHSNNTLKKRYLKFKFKDAEKIAEIFIKISQEFGINACISSPRAIVAKAIDLAIEETNSEFYWICTPSRRKTVKDLERDIFKQIDWCFDNHVAVCMPHRSYTDKSINLETLTIGGTSDEFPPYEELSSYIRDKGMIPGLSTHFVETIEAIERHNYDAPILTQPFNKMGFESNTSPEELLKRIQSTHLKIINIKPMAAGRLKPDVLEWNLQNIKNDDFIAIGGTKLNHFIYDIKLMEKWL